MLDPLLLRTFLVIAAGNSFSETSRRLSLRQSTVSDHVRRLEQAIGHQLFLRDTHSVALTREGEALVGFARDILAAHERTERHFAGGRPRARLRVGLSPEVGAASLMAPLRAFAASHPDIELDVTVAPAGLLRTALDARDLDAAVCEGRRDGTDGERLRRDELAWVGAAAGVAEAAVLPLILPPAPSLLRALALAGLGVRPWRLAGTGHGPDDIAAAAAAGLGIAVLPDRLVPAGLVRVTGLPALDPRDVIALHGSRMTDPATGVAVGELVVRLRAWGEAG